MEIKINGKSLLAIALLSIGIASANFVSLVDSDSAGGITLIEENTPVGSVSLWLGSTAPTDWVFMQGQSTTSYPELAAVIGSTIPDMRGNFARGVGGKSGGLGQIQGQSVQALTFKGNVLPHHNHSVTVYGRNGKYSSDGQSYNSSVMQGAASDWTPQIDRSDVTHSVSAGTPSGLIEGTGIETRPKNVAFHYIIKIK